MKALVIAPQPFFSPRGTPFSVYYRTLVTAELGVKIDLLTYGQGQNVKIPGVRIIRIPDFKRLGEIKIGPSYLKLFLDLFVIIYTIALLMKTRYDFVHAHEESIFFCRFLKPIFRFKLVYDMHSSLPQQLTNFKFTQSKILIKIFKMLEDSCLRASDVVITICPDLAEYVKNFVIGEEQHFLIENSIFEPVRLIDSSTNKNDCCSSNKKGSESNLALPGERRFVVYAGTLEPYQGIDILIKAFPKVLKKAPDAFLVVVGGNAEQVDLYSRMAEDLKLNGQLKFSGRVTQSLAKQFCAAASVQVSPRSGGTNTPLKIYEQIASGIPLVATDIYSHTQVLNPETAFLVQPEPEDMARGIIAALNSDALREKVTRNAQKLYEENYSRPIYEQKMRKVLELVS